MKVKDIKNKTMTLEKYQENKYCLFCFYVLRPISYLLTIPCIKLKIKPNVVSLISIFPVILGFLFIGFGSTLYFKLIGWCLFLLWGVLDCVDGNIARFTNQTSKLGSLFDATFGYFAMIFIFLAMGTGCYYGDFCFLHIDQALMITLGGISACLSILPRLVMHKRMVCFGEEDYESKNLKNKANFSFVKIIGLNLTSVTDIIHIFMLLSIIFKFMDLFVILYFFINLIVCIYSIVKLLRVGQ